MKIGFKSANVEKNELFCGNLPETLLPQPNFYEFHKNFQCDCEQSLRAHAKLHG